MCKFINCFFVLPIFILIGVSNNLHAQKREMKTKNLPAYEGTWQYAIQTDTFILVLKLNKKVTKNGSRDCLYGLHYYKKNGVVIDNYLGSTPTQSNWTFEATNAIYIEFEDEIDPNVVSVLYKDNNKQQDKGMHGQFDLNPNNPEEMTWTLTQKQREVINFEGLPPEPEQDMSSTIPKTMVLKKIK